MVNKNWTVVELGDSSVSQATDDNLKVTLQPGVYSVQLGEKGVKGIAQIDASDQVVLIFDKPFTPD